jgi:peroxiredoxin family protein
MAGAGRLAIVVFSGDYDRVHYALAMASAAAAVNRPATLFFTMGALKALRRDSADGVPGWVGLDPAGNGASPALRDADHAGAGIAGFEELLAACVELGVTIMVCEMGLKAENMTAEDLRADVPVKPGGLVTFLAEAGEDGRIVFI